MLPPLVLGDHKGIRNLVSDTDSGEKSNKCKQCNYASSDLGNLRTHLKMHSREKYEKCNQCDYASSRAGNLRIHLKTHSEEKTSILCNQLRYAANISNKIVVLILMFIKLGQCEIFYCAF